MAKLTKIINGEYIGANKYKITDTGDGKSTVEFSPDTILTPGTPVGAEILNEIQKNGLYQLNGTKRTEGQEDIYDCTFEGIENFEFEEINILMKPNANSTLQNVFINLGGTKYKIISNTGNSSEVFENQNTGFTLKKSTLQAIKWDMSMPVVDNLTTNDGKKALSAKMGKKLQDEKEPKIDKKTGFNLDKSDSFTAGGTNTLATSEAVKLSNVANMGITQNGTFPLTSAIEGNTYRANNGKLYKCIKAYSGSQISVPNENFKELSIWENNNRLDNLDKASISNIVTGECENLILGSTFNFLEDIPNGSLLYAATGLTSNNTYVKSFFIFNKNDSMVIPTYHGNVVLKYLGNNNCKILGLDDQLRTIEKVRIY